MALCHHTRTAHTAAALFRGQGRPLQPRACTAATAAYPGIRHGAAPAEGRLRAHWDVRAVGLRSFASSCSPRFPSGRPGGPGGKHPRASAESRSGSSTLKEKERDTDSRAIILGPGADGGAEVGAKASGHKSTTTSIDSATESAASKGAIKTKNHEISTDEESARRAAERTKEDEELLTKLFGKPVVGIDNMPPPEPEPEVERSSTSTSAVLGSDERDVEAPEAGQSPYEAHLRQTKLKTETIDEIRHLVKVSVDKVDSRKINELTESELMPPVTPEETARKVDEMGEGPQSSLLSMIPDNLNRTDITGSVKRRTKRVYVGFKFLINKRIENFKEWLWMVLVPEFSKLFNELTGYSAVAKSKDSVLELDEKLARAKRRAHESKLAYEKIVEDRHRIQRELNGLLHRKDTWIESDITQFTEVYRKDVTMEHKESTAKKEQKVAANEFDESHRLYLNGIRERYIEEQLYSDKIRRASTWWTWGLISLHFIIFILVQLVFEPRKRKNMVDNIREEFITVTDDMMSKIEAFERERDQRAEEASSLTTVFNSNNWKEIQDSLVGAASTISSKVIPVAKKPEGSDSEENKSVDPVNGSIDAGTTVAAVANSSSHPWYHRFYSDYPMTVIPKSILRKISSDRSLEFLDGAVLGTTLGIFSTALIFFIRG